MKVLLVEDNEDATASVRVMLAELGGPPIAVTHMVRVSLAEPQQQPVESAQIRTLAFPLRLRPRDQQSAGCDHG